ncbi:hypothetical protein ANO11243_092320 [Dothideomycetidae sp. 11243]|nr:hypothetical protein ANO11243_092320 [fungal sp. No.11243]
MSTECHGQHRSTALVKKHVTHSAAFCEWYLNAPRTRSPLDLKPHEVKQACTCLLREAGLHVPHAHHHTAHHAAHPTHSPLVSHHCNKKYKKAIKKSFFAPRKFCKFYNAVHREHSPIPGLSAAQVRGGCHCYHGHESESATVKSTLGHKPTRHGHKSHKVTSSKTAAHKTRGKHSSHPESTTQIPVATDDNSVTTSSLGPEQTGSFSTSTRTDIASDSTPSVETNMASFESNMATTTFAPATSILTCDQGPTTFAPTTRVFDGTSYQISYTLSTYAPGSLVGDGQHYLVTSWNATELAFTEFVSSCITLAEQKQTTIFGNGPWIAGFWSYLDAPGSLTWHCDVIYPEGGIDASFQDAQDPQFQCGWGYNSTYIRE